MDRSLMTDRGTRLVKVHTSLVTFLVKDWAKEVSPSSTMGACDHGWMRAHLLSNPILRSLYLFRSDSRIVPSTEGYPRGTFSMISQVGAT